MTSKTVFVIEPFYGGSHKKWLDNLAKHATIDVKCFTLSAHHWKWRMAAGAVELAEKVNREVDIPAYIFVTDMLDLALFKSLLRYDYQHIKIGIYFHENQLTYPWNDKKHRERDRQFALKNFTSLLVADDVIFNSSYHRDCVFDALPEFLNAFPDNLDGERIEGIRLKSRVLSPGIDTTELETVSDAERHANRILWNHRWEHDKNPDDFFEILFELKDEGVEFELAVIGERFKTSPIIFEKAKEVLSKEIVAWGYLPNRQEYIRCLKSSALLPVTSNQEFFGISVMEAAFCGVKPLLPKRLSYPSIFSDKSLFYESKDELKAMIKRDLANINRFQLPSEFDEHSWSVLIHEYEKLWSDS